MKRDLKIAITILWILVAIFVFLAVYKIFFGGIYLQPKIFPEAFNAPAERCPDGVKSGQYHCTGNTGKKCSGGYLLSPLIVCSDGSVCDKNLGCVKQVQQIEEFSVADY